MGGYRDRLQLALIFGFSSMIDSRQPPTSVSCCDTKLTMRKERNWTNWHVPSVRQAAATDGAIHSNFMEIKIQLRTMVEANNDWTMNRVHTQQHVQASKFYPQFALFLACSPPGGKEISFIVDSTVFLLEKLKPREKIPHRTWNICCWLASACV